MLLHSGIFAMMYTSENFLHENLYITLSSLLHWTTGSWSQSSPLIVMCFLKSGAVKAT